MRYASSLAAVVAFVLVLAPAPFAYAVDCDGDSVEDLTDDFPGADEDSNANGIPDVCERDCDRNGIPDAIEMASGAATDCDKNGLLDSCDVTPRPAFVEVVTIADFQERVVDIAVADVDGDGDLDLVLAVDFHVAILRNEGARRFAAPELHLVSSKPAFVATADMDGDGAVDIVTANSLGTGLFDNVSVLLNEGDTFAAPRSFVAGHGPVAMMIRDFDGNGLPDVAVLSASSRDLALLWNEGDGRLGIAQRTPWDQIPVAMYSADFDVDGDPDLLVSLRDSSLELLLNEGDGEFTREDFLVCPGHTVATGDLDSDGRPEIVVSCPGFRDHLRVFWNRDRDFVAGFVSIQTFPHVMTMADIDGDNDLDIVAGSTSRQLGLFYNTGAGLLAKGWWRDVAENLFRELKPADLDGDGMLDLPVFNNATQLEVVFGGLSTRSPDCNGNGVPDACEIEAGTSSDCDGNRVPDECDLVDNDCNANGLLDRCEVMTASVPDCDANGIPDECDIREQDCNGNGRPDACDFGSQLELLKSEGIALEHTIRYLQTSDLDGDGDADAVGVSEAPGHVVPFLNRGDGSFDVGAWVATGSTPKTVELADLDGDGNDDVILGTRFSGALILRGDGQGALSAPEAIDDVNASWLTVGDFNGDGPPDIAVLEKKSEMFVHNLLILQNDGNARFARLPEIPHSCCPALLVSGDVEGDGDVDIIAASDGGCLQACDGLHYAVFVNRGGAVFDKQDVRGLVPHITTVLLQDLDLDGRLDMATGERVYFHSGGGLFNHPARLGGDLVMIAVADFDGDGYGELVRSRFFGTPAVFVHRNQRDRSFGSGPTIGMAASTRAAATADFDGDGDVDLLTGSLSFGGDPPGILTLLRNESTPPVSVDLNRNGIPDECEASFHRADPNVDGSTNVADAIFLLEYLFAGRHSLACRETADFFNDGRLNMADAIAILNYLFAGGLRPALPGPPEQPCGVDPEEPGSPGDLGCERYDACGV